ncbi:hypothetical protein EGT74_04565 [Chitinophaga lutea]|uniref:Uncharacterized protein n=1 Tax=Chitinophaga lutea TaxID=2488634 RepID=A0A3N4PVZ6_9BACT|nr:hypothetical protein [Chitinophaga lutea]RPE12822.1 hypothetical protein EGT74_04565 [Chitinophaga lutea]
MEKKYDFTTENFTRIINSDTVPAHDHNGLDLEFGDTEITIKKPYIDADGEEMGNSIFILHDNTLCISMRSEGGFLFTFYRENENESFKNLEAGSPDSIKEFTWQIWTKIVNYIDDMNAGKTPFHAFREQFGIYSVPYDLEKLFEFEKEYGGGSYADGFYLNAIDKTGLKTYSEEEGFLNSFIEFATATGGGSIYAIWVINENLDKCPIVVFGDEGGIHLVAKNTTDLIHLLGYDVEIFVDWSSAYFYKGGENDNRSEHRDAFLAWSKTNFGLEPVRTDEEAAAIVQVASDQYADSLYDFLIKYDIDVEEGYETVQKHRSFEAFEKNFQGRETPQELVSLYAFQQSHANYSQYFLLRGYDSSILKTWSQSDAFISAVIPFARATSFGACYALWDERLGKETKDMPVIVLDRENGIDVVAENVLQLLRLLTYDIEPVLDGECFKLSNDKDSYSLSNNIDAYRSWLTDNFKIAPVEEPYEEIIDPAQAKFSDAFWHWENLHRPDK